MYLKHFIIFLIMVISSAAAAHRINAYDQKIRNAANLPPAWFVCKTVKDCDLVSVPCKSDIAVNALHKEETRQALIERYPLCLGESIHESEASCDGGQCVTNPKDLPNNGN